MTIRELLDRNSAEDQIEVGGIVEGAMNGRFGEVLREVTSRMKEGILLESRRDKTLDANRYLGRLESLDLLLFELRDWVQTKNDLMRELKESKKV